MRVEMSERLKELLDYMRENQADMSKKTGISRAVLSRYFSGEREPRQDKIATIANAYNVDPAWLMGFDVPMRKRLSSDQAQEDFAFLDKIHKLNDLQKKALMIYINTLLGEDPF